MVITGHVFMLDDQPFCTNDCRLQACRTVVNGHQNGGGGGGSVDYQGSMTHSVSGVSLASSNTSMSSGLYASFKAWM
jgi:hypothetical protein